MPQTFNPIQLYTKDEIPNGPNSRFMRAVNCSLDIRKRVHTVMALEKKRYVGAVRNFDHLALLEQQRMRRMEEKVRQKMKYNKAKKQVFESDDLHSANNYQRALNEKITERARRYRDGVSEALLKMDPSYQRQQKAKKMLEKSKLDNLNIMQRNLVELSTERPPLLEIPERGDIQTNEYREKSDPEIDNRVYGFSSKEAKVKTNNGIITKLMVRKNTMHKTQTPKSSNALNE